MRAVHWVLVALYFASVVGFAVVAVLPDSELSILIILAVAVISQLVFICGAGTKDLWRPIRRPRLVLPVAAAALALGTLVAFLTAAICELMDVEWVGDVWVFAGLLAANWLIWFLLLFVYTQHLERYHVIHYLAKAVFAGSLAEMLAAVPAHLIVDRRSGCFTGISTGLGIIAGLCVMLWSFGPGVFLLCLHQVRVARGMAPPARDRVGHRRRARLQFRVRDLMLITLATGVIAGLSRTLWGEWFAMAAAAALWVYLITMVLLREPLVRILVAVGVLAGTAYCFWGNWLILFLFVLPGIVFCSVLIHVFAQQSE